MPTHIRRYLGRSAIHNSDPRLVPAIIACNFSICFLLFGVFLTIAGIVFRSVASSSSYEISSFTPTSNPSQTAVTVGTVILCLGAVLTGIGLALIIYAWITFKRVQTLMTSAMANSTSVTNLNLETSFSTATHYPAPMPSNHIRGYRSERLYTIQDEFEPPPSYSTLPNDHQVIESSVLSTSVVNTNQDK